MGYFAKFFGSDRDRLRKATCRGVSGDRIRNVRGLTREEALHWLLHSARGQSLARAIGEPLDALADHVVAASARVAEERNSRSAGVNDDDANLGGEADEPSAAEAMTDLNLRNKQEQPMSKNFDLVEFSKRVVHDGMCAVNEEQATTLIKAYADSHRLPNESSAAAFARIYTGSDDVGLAFRKMIQVAKNIPHPHV